MYVSYVRGAAGTGAVGRRRKPGRESFAKIKTSRPYGRDCAEYMLVPFTRVSLELSRIIDFVLSLALSRRPIPTNAIHPPRPRPFGGQRFQTNRY